MPGAVTVGSLVVNMSANTATLKTDLNDGASAVKSTSQAMVNAWAGVTTETTNATAAGSRLVTQLKEQIATFGMTQQELTQYKANIAGVGDEASALIGRLKSMEDAQKAYAAGVEEARAHTEAFSLASAGASRELIVLAHEMLQGNYSRFGGSMMVLAERTGAASLIMSAAGLTIGLLVGAVVAAIVVYERWKDEVDTLNRGLAATNNFSGQTRDSINSMAASIQSMSTGGLSAANTALSGLVATGKFSGATLQSAGQAALAFGQLTGKSSEEVIQYFSGMTSGVANWAETANQSYHFMNGAQYEHIATLEKEGHAQQAMKEVLDLMSGTMKVHAQDLNVITYCWTGWKLAIEDVNAALKKVFFPTAGQEMEKAIAKLKALQDQQRTQGVGFDENGADPGLADKIAAQRKVIHDLIAKSNAEEIDAAKKQTLDLSALSAVAAQKDLDQIKQSVRTQQQIREDAAKKIRDDADAVNADAALNGQKMVMTTEQVNELVAQSNAKYADKAVKDDPNPQLLSNALAANKELLAAAKAKYDQMGAMDDLYHRYGVTSDDQYYQQKKEIALGEQKAAIDAYDKDLATLADYDNRTVKEQAETQGKIEKIQSEKVLALQKYNGLISQYDAEDKLRQDAVVQAGDAAASKYIDSLNRQIEALKASNGAREVSRVAVQNETIAMTKLAIANMEATNSMPLSDIHTQLDVEIGEKNVAMLKEQLSVQIQLGDELRRQEADASLSKMFQEASAAAKQMESDMTASFGNIGTAIGQLNVLFLQNGKTQHDLAVQYAKDMADAAGAVDVAQAQQQALQKYQQAQSLQEVKNYGDMAAAASNFFNKGTAGYKLLEDAQRVFRIAEMAMTLEAEAVKLTSITTTSAADATATDASVVNSGVRATADGIAAFAKTLASLPFPYNLAAGAVVVAALVAAGVSMHGGGGSGSTPDPNAAAQVQATQGSGTVLGDVNKQSKSIADSITLLASNSTEMLPLTAQMANSLQNIEAAISGVTNIVAGQDPGIVNGTNLGDLNSVTQHLSSVTNALGGFLGGNAITNPMRALFGGLFGSSSSKVTDSGLQIGGTVGSLEQGQGVNQYANVQTTSSSWFGLSKSTSDSTQTAAVDAAISKQFGLIFQNLQTTLEAAGQALGKSTTDVGNAVSNFVVNTTKISLNGLSGTALTDAINQVISATMDNVAKSIFPDLSAFQQVGEGYAQTVVRVATGVEQADSALQHLGVAAINFTDIANKQGDVGAEIVRQSLDAVETVNGTLTGVGKIISTLQGTASDLASTYSSLLAIRAQLQAVGADGKNLSESMIQGAGSISTLGSSLNDYFTDYFSDTERAAAETQAVGKQIAALGVAVPNSLAGFRALVQGIDTSTDAGAKLYGQLIALSGAFYTATTDTANAATAMTQTLQTNLANAQSALTTAYNNEASALNNVISAMKTFAASTITFRNSLLIGSNSPLSPTDVYKTAKAQYESTLSSAEKGDTTAQGQLQSAATAFLDASKSYNASNTQYAADFNEVQKGLTQMSDIATKAADTAQAQLDALNASVSGLITINNSVITVADGIAGVQSAISALAAATSSAISAAAASSSESAAVAFEQAHGENMGGGFASQYGDWSAAILTQMNAAGDFKTPVVPILDTSLPHRELGGQTPAGLTVVGETGPELVDFGAPSFISTASQTRSLLGNGDSTAEQKAQTKELRATVTLLSMGFQTLVAKVEESNQQLAAIKKKAKFTGHHMRMPRND